MKHITHILLAMCLLLPVATMAQTPYDSFSPETWHPMLDMGVFECEEETQVIEPKEPVAYDTILCAAVIDRQEQVLLLVDIENLAVVASAPLTDDLYKWISVDPLVDKNIATSPYMYCNGNPIIYIDLEGANPVYSPDGEFLGINELGLQGEALIIDKRNFRNGMSIEESLVSNMGIGSLSPEAYSKYMAHYHKLSSRPDWDGIVTINEGVKWARQHQGALRNPTPDNTLYINAALLDFGNISISDCKNGVGAISPINLLTEENIKNAVGKPMLANTVYALGRVNVILQNNFGHISIVNDAATDYDWNKGGGFKRNALLFLEGIRTQLPYGSGFKTFYYGVGNVRK